MRCLHHEHGNICIEINLTRDTPVRHLSRRSHIFNACEERCALTVLRAGSIW